MTSIPVGRPRRAQADSRSYDAQRHSRERVRESAQEPAEDGVMVQSVLSLDGLGIRKVVDAPPGVEVLSVRDNRLKALGAVSSCSSLRELNLAGNRFQEAALVPLAKMVHLSALDISRNQVRGLEALFPDSAGEFGSAAFPRLEVLDVSENLALTDVQPAMAARSLRILRANGIAALALSCKPTPALQVLEMASCSLAAVENLQALSSLHELVLDGNALLACASVLAHPQLETLRLAKNAVARAPPPELPSLRTLDLAANQLAELPPLGGAWNITSLSLRENDLTSLGALATLRHLTFLDASCNHLQELEPSLALGALKPLRALVLSGNDIERAEDVLGVLVRTDRPALEHLDLRDNPLSFAFYPEGAQQLPAWTWDAEASLETGCGGARLLDDSTRQALEQYRGACANACPALQSLDGVLVSARERWLSSLSPQSVQTTSQMCVSEVQTQQSWWENDVRLGTSHSTASRGNQDPEEVVYGTPYPTSETAEPRARPSNYPNIGQLLPDWPPPPVPAASARIPGSQDAPAEIGTHASWAEVVASITALQDTRRSGPTADAAAAALMGVEFPTATSDGGSQQTGATGGLDELAPLLRPCADVPLSRSSRSGSIDPTISPRQDGSPRITGGLAAAAILRSGSAERRHSGSSHQMDPAISPVPDGSPRVATGPGSAATFRAGSAEGRHSTSSPAISPVLEGSPGVTSGLGGAALMRSGSAERRRSSAGSILEELESQQITPSCSVREEPPAAATASRSRVVDGRRTEVGERLLRITASLDDDGCGANASAPRKPPSPAALSGHGSVSQEERLLGRISSHRSEEMSGVQAAKNGGLAAPLLGAPHEPAPTDALPRARGSHTADPFSAPSLWHRQPAELPPSPVRSARTPSMPSRAPKDALRTQSEFRQSSTEDFEAQVPQRKASDCLGGSSARTAYLRFLEDEIIAQRAFLRMHRNVSQGQATPRRRQFFSRSAEAAGAAAFSAKRRAGGQLALGTRAYRSANLQQNIDEHALERPRGTKRERYLAASWEEEKQDSADQDEDENSSDSDEGITFSLARGCATRKRAALPPSAQSSKLTRNSAAKSAAGGGRPETRGIERSREDLCWDSAHSQSSIKPRMQSDLDLTCPADADQGGYSSSQAPATGIAATGSATRRESSKAGLPESAEAVVTGPLLFNGSSAVPADLGSRHLGDPLQAVAVDLERGIAASPDFPEIDRAARLAAGLDEVREFSRRTPAVPSALLRDVRIVQTNGPDFGDDPYKVSMAACKPRLSAPSLVTQDESVTMLGSCDDTWAAVVTAASAGVRQLLEELIAQQAWRVPGRPVLYQYALGRAVQTETSAACRCFKTLSVRDVARAGAAPPRLSQQQRAFFCGEARKLAEVISSPFGFAPVFEGMVLLFALDLRHAEALSASCDWAPCNCGAAAPPRLLGRTLVAELALGRCHTAEQSLQDAISTGSASQMSKSAFGAASGAVPMSPVFEAAYRDGADSVYFPQSGVIAILNPMRALPLFLAEYRRERVTLTGRARPGV